MVIIKKYYVLKEKKDKMQKPDELKAIKELLCALEKGEISAGEKGWVSYDEARKVLGV